MSRIRLAGIIPMGEGYALMHRKDVIKNPDRQEYYVFPGGGREGEETYEEGTLREIKEEFGIDVKIIKKVYEEYSEKFDQTTIYYLCEYVSGKFGTGTGPEFSNNPTISYINQDNQEKQYEFYIMSQKGDIKVTIVILKNNIIKILDDENHQVHYYQSQNINYEKLNIDHLPW